jgi:hypothetical protein
LAQQQALRPSYQLRPLFVHEADALSQVSFVRQAEAESPESLLLLRLLALALVLLLAFLPFLSLSLYVLEEGLAPFS